MPEAIDAFGLLAGSRNWTAADDAGMKRWFTRYYTWLTTSDAGKEEAGHPNNRGSWCQAQVAIMALFLFAAGYTHDPKYTDGLKRFECETTAQYEIIALGNKRTKTLSRTRSGEPS
jgi:hypothetical protein